MTDRYERIRAALAMGPTPGPWSPSYDKGSTRDIFTEQGKLPVCMVRGVTYVGQEQYLANGHFIAACDPDTIRALLGERDALAAENARLREDAEKLRETLRAVSAVGIVQLFNTARDDVLAEFSLAELQEISRVTEHLRTAYVEHIYRAAWDAAIDQARGGAGQEVGNG